MTIAIYILSCLFLSVYFRPQKWIIFLLAGSSILFCLLSFIQLTGANPFLLYPNGHNFYGSGIYYSGVFLGNAGNAGLSGAFLSIVAGMFSMALIKCNFALKWILTLPLFMVALLIFSMDVDAALLALVVGHWIMLPVAITSRTCLVRTLFVTAIIMGSFIVSKIIVFGDGITVFNSTGLIFIFVPIIITFIGFIIIRVDFLEKLPVKYFRLGALAFVIVSSCFALFYLLFFGAQHSGMIYEASQILQGRWDDTFGTRRIYIWRNVIERIKLRNLLLGTGPDTLGHWDIQPFTRFSEELGIMLVSGIDAAHNEYLHILATGGLLSLLSYIGALIYSAVNWFRFADNTLSAISGAGVLFYCIQAFFGISMFITAPFFWTILAVLIYSHSHT